MPNCPVQVAKLTCFLLFLERARRVSVAHAGHSCACTPMQSAAPPGVLCMQLGPSAHHSDTDVIVMRKLVQRPELSWEDWLHASVDVPLASVTFNFTGALHVVAPQ